jgi:hypothetical protein
MTPPKVNNPMVTDTKDSEEKEIPNKELKNMINEMKENMCKKMNKFKEMKEHDIKR